MFLCPNAAAVCNATTAAAQATTPAAGTFSFRPDVGTWQVRAVLNNGNDAFVTNIIVDATGNISQNNLAISL